MVLWKTFIIPPGGIDDVVNPFSKQLQYLQWKIICRTENNFSAVNKFIFFRDKNGNRLLGWIVKLYCLTEHFRSKGIC